MTHDEKMKVVKEQLKKGLEKLELDLEETLSIRDKSIYSIGYLQGSRNTCGNFLKEGLLSRN